MEINQETGYLEDTRQINASFSSENKKKFIQLAQEYQDKHHNFPPISDICRAIGITTRTFYKHLSFDSVFKHDWKELQCQLQAHFTSKIGEKANTKQGTLANLAALRYLESGSWNPSGLNPISQDSPTKEINSRFSEAIDVEIVPESKLLTEKPAPENHLNKQ
jgi:hypothetical protein